MAALLRYGITAVAVIFLFTVPAVGLLATRRLRLTPALAAAPVVTCGAFGAIALIGVVAPTSVPATAQVLVPIFVVTGCLAAWRHRADLKPDRHEATAMATVVALFAVVLAFLSITSTPWVPPVTIAMPAHRVESPRIPGLVVDSHLPYRVAQITQHEQGGSQLEDDFSNGWWISDRTPLMGLGNAVVASVVGVTLPTQDPLQLPPFERKLVDDAGYWLYLMVSAWIALSSLFSLFAVVRHLADGLTASIATAVAALMPGIFLYAIYPRPSLTLAPFCLVGILAALRRAPIAAGACVALAYLTHPTGLWWSIPIGLLLVWPPGAEAGETSAFRRLRDQGLRAGGAAVLLVVPWQYFTMVHMQASSKLLTWPLGYRLEERRDLGAGIESAIDHWQANGGLGWAVWVRISAVAQSVVPRGFFGLSGPDHIQGDKGWYQWSGAHFYAGIGIAGIVISFLVLRGLGMLAPDGRRLPVTIIVVPLLTVAVLFEGVPESFVFQGLLALVLLAAAPAALALRSARRWSAGVAITLLTIEAISVAWSPGLVRPDWTPQFRIAFGCGVLLHAALGALLWRLVVDARTASVSDAQDVADLIDGRVETNEVV